MNYESNLVVGAGPAGIVTVLRLLENDNNYIIWCDPEFKVGDFGTYYGNVSSNTTVDQFRDSMKQLSLIEKYDLLPDSLEIMILDGASRSKLSLITEALQYITNKLIDMCNNNDINLEIKRVHLDEIEIDNYNKIYLATGSRPRVGNYDVPNIDLYDALDIRKLIKKVSINDTVCVVGNAHSGVLVMKSLYDIGVMNIYCIYKDPLIYAADGEHDGLKGLAAEWAKEYLDDKQDIVFQVQYNDPSIDSIVAKCNKVIYCIGFEMNMQPILCQHNNKINNISYNCRTGKIHGLHNVYGVGIAFPSGFIKDDECNMCTCEYLYDVSIPAFINHIINMTKL